MTIQSTCKRFLLGAALAIAVGTAPIAQADILDTSSYVIGYQTFNVSIGPGNVQAGAFEGTWNGQEIVFWCIELTQFFQLGESYTNYTPALYNETTLGMLAQLFNQAYAQSLTSTTNSAAFQLAIWEIFYDSGSLVLTEGIFDVYSSGAAVGIAQGWLNSLGNYSDSANLFLLNSGQNQNFLTYQPGPGPFSYLVPEPGSLALAAIALVTMAFALRRRRQDTGA